MAKVTKTEIRAKGQVDAGQKVIEKHIKDQSADELRSAAVKEVPSMLKVLLNIASDQSGAGGPRVAAARAVCELAGQLGPVKEIPESLADKEIGEMSLAELERFIRQGQKMLGS